jgi:hypothetical protein
MRSLSVAITEQRAFRRKTEVWNTVSYGQSFALTMALRMQEVWAAGV